MKAQVLILEDHPAYRQRLESAAQARGFQVLPACARPEDAIPVFHRSRPDIVVLDLHLPGQTTGIELCRLMVDLDREVRVVVSSSFSDPDLMDHAFQAGAHRCLRKPFRVEEALRLFENLVVELDEVFG